MDPVEKAKQLGSKKFARQVKHEAKQFKRDIAQSQAVNTCWHCDKGTSYLPVGTQLLVCSKCKGIGRIIRYCSRYVPTSFLTSRYVINKLEGSARSKIGRTDSRSHTERYAGNLSKKALQSSPRKLRDLQLTRSLT